MTTPEMRICRWCGFTFEGPSTRLSACPKCGQGNDHRAQHKMFSISASNARPDDLLIAVPHMLAAIQELRHALAATGRELADLKARKP